LCQTTSTPASAHATIDALAGNLRAANKISPAANLRSIMISVLGRQLWKNKLAAGVLSIVVAAVVLVWPLDSIVVLTLVCGVSLVILGVIQIVQAFQIRNDTNTARDTVEALSEQVPA
jgi:uncharacterized membrane protein HdeD (DUF308 family)